MAGTIVTQLGFNAQSYVWDVCEFKGELYGGTYNSANLFKWNGVDAWELAAPQYALPAQSDIYSLCVYNNKLYAGTSPGGLLLEYDEAGGWILRADKILAQPAIMSLAVFNGRLYAGSGNSCFLSRWDDVDSWELVAEPPALEHRLQSLTVYNGELYAGTVKDSAVGELGGKLYRYNESAGTMDLVAGQLEGQTQIRRLVIHKDEIYGSTYPHGMLFKWNGVDSWEKKAGQIDGQVYMGGLVAGGRLYASSAYDGNIYSWNDVDSWELIGTTSETGLWDILVYNNRVYGGSSPNATLIELTDVIIVCDFSAAPLTGVGPTYVQFTDASAGATSWLWDFGDGQSSAEQNPNHLYGPGTFSPSLTINGTETLQKVNYVVIDSVSIGADPVSGIAPLTVVFTAGGLTAVYTFLWNFGDGGTSTEKDPKHRYLMPGTYSVSLEIYDANGTLYSYPNAITIRVYDFEVGVLHVAFTDVCYRSAVLPTQGRGITAFTGENWVYPTAYCGTKKGLLPNGNTVSLVCNNRNGRFYRIGIPEQWTDRMGDYGGEEIACKFKLKERTAVAGEYQEIEHVESHIHIRPWKETYRNDSGYTDEGFRNSHAASIQAYENGEPTTPAAKLQDISRYGDYVFRKRIEARRIQEEYLFDTAAWRVVKTQEQYMPIDKASGPSFDYPSETQWQEEFRGADLWMSRDRLRPTYNRAIGRAMTGSYDVLTTGPDSQSNSAMAMTAIDSLTAAGLADMTGDFTLSLWVGDIAATPGVIYQCDAGAGTLAISITAAAGVYSIAFDDDVNGYSRQLSWTGSGWVHLVVIRSGTRLYVYENGVSIYSTLMADSTIAYGGDTIVSNATICSVFDIRRIPAKVVTAEAILYYYNEVTTNGRQCAFLPINR